MAPDTADTGLANAQLFGQSIAAPVGGPVGRTLTGGLQDTCLALGGYRVLDALFRSFREGLLIS